MRFNGQLDFTQNRVIKPDVYEYVICTVFESVFDPNYLEFVVVLFHLIHSQHLVEYFENFLFFGRKFTSHQVSYFEGD